MTDLFQEPRDATPLTPEEREGLRQTWITYRNDLNEAERDNILAGTAWAGRLRGLTTVRLLQDAFLRDLHRRMFGSVWKWAGHYRQSERNIGIAAYRIPTELAGLTSDVRFWIEQKTFSADEIAVRFHHRLVAIHPFPNGNGRHARLMADLLAGCLGGKPFSWGGGSLADVGELRARYIGALQAADDHDIEPLLAFARS